MRSRGRGFTLLEILVASAVAGLLLAFLGTYFARQASISTDVRDRAALHLTLRTVAEAVAQDLTSAGARAVSVGGVPRYVDAVDATCGAVYVTCGGTSGVATVTYASSLHAEVLGGLGAACRQVRYTRTDRVVYRQDVPCGATFDAAPGFGDRLARGVDALGLTFTCAEPDASGAVVETADPTTCPVGVRAARIEVSGTGPSGGRTDTVTLEVGMPNARGRGLGEETP